MKLTLTHGLLAIVTFFSFNLNAQVTQRGTTQTSNSLSNTITITTPAGIQVDDILIVQIVQSDNDNATLSDATSPGWTFIRGRKVKTNSSREWWATLLFKRVTESDLLTNSYTFNLDADAVGD